MKVRVLYFARAKEAVGGMEQESVELLPDTEAQTTLHLIARLVAMHPALESVLRSCVLALNQEYLGKGEDTALKEVGFPPRFMHCQ